MISSTDIGEALLAGLSQDPAGSPLDAKDNAYEFVLAYRPVFDNTDIGEGLLGDWSHLRDLYEDAHRFQVVMASAQSGKTGWIVTAVARETIGSAWGRLVGFYFPDKELPIKYSRDRVRPFFKSSPALAPLIGAPDASGKKGVDATLTVSVGPTMLYFMTIGGRTSTEGVPLKGVAFDEVRRMSIGDIERAQQRYSAQRDPFDFKTSTPGYPDSTIDLFFQHGDQRYFHTGCDCPDGIVLPQRWPDCVGDLRSATPMLRNKVARQFELAGMPFCGFSDPKQAEQYPPAFYRCPTCGKVLANPRDGYWEQHNPRAFVHSWQFGKMLSPMSPPGRVLDVFERSKDQQEFFNSELGLPYLNEQQRPVKHRHIDACVDRELAWAVQMDSRRRDREVVNTSMGVDVQAGYGIAVVKQWRPNGKRRVLHAEVVWMDNPTQERTWWHRLGAMMRYFDVRFAVVDEQPEYSQTLAFAKAFPGKVYLANYHLTPKAPRFIQWEDEALAKDSKQLGEADIRYRVSMDRTRALHWSVHLWKNRMNEVPNLDTLTQLLPQQGGKPVFSPHLEVGSKDAAVTAVPRILQDHLTRFVFRNILDSDETPRKRGTKPLPNQVGATQWVAEHVGTSPDFAHADLYANAGLERMGGG